MRVHRTAISTLALLLAGCTDAGDGLEGEPARPRAATSPSPAFEFDLADLLKPRMEDEVGIDPYLAPLLYLEAAEPVSGGAIGTPFLDGSGELALDTAQPTLYFADGTTVLQGVRRRQLSFVWFRTAEGGSRPAPQGLRMTLDVSGQPELMEILAHSSGDRVVYTAEGLGGLPDESVEDPAVGRSPASGADRSADPPVVVAGHFSTGPAPTGPYLYQARDSTDVTDLHCRCRPTRARAIREVREYRLEPLERLEGLWPGPGERGWGPPDLAFSALRLSAQSR